MTLPNAITIARILLIPVIAWLIAERRFDIALPTLFFTGMSDAVDGYIARRLGQTSRLGAILDPIADKGLLITVYLALAYARAIPIWIVVLVIGRDIIIVLGALLLTLLKRRREFPPTTWGKISTFYQLMLAGGAVWRGAYPEWMPVPVLVFFVAGVTVATVISGFDYVRRGAGWSA